MGILSDILEDNKERAGQLLSCASQPTSEPRIEILPARTICCPLCAAWFASEEDLQRHILGAHRQLQAYVRFNGRVIQDLQYTDELIQELLVVVLGDQEATVSIRIADQESHELVIRPGRPRQMANLVPPNFIGAISVCIAFGHVRRKYEIYRSTQPRIDVESLDAAIRELQANLLTATEPNWPMFRNTWLQARERHVMEKRYLEGFFEYILASHMEMNRNPQAGRHFERAFGLIRPFATSMAHTARCLLGIKMNWFHLLTPCSPHSKFHSANIFFNSDFENVARVRMAPDVSFRDAVGVWIDPFSELVLESIRCFFLRDHAKLESVFARLEGHPLVADRNNFDKLSFLKARRSRVQRKLDSAEQHYRYLRYHPIFKIEAEAFCEKRGKP